MRRSFPLLAAFACVVAAAPLSAQTKSPITPDDYGKWERLGSGTLSPDGRWLAYSISRVNEENELRIRLVGSDSVIVTPYGSRPTFSHDNRWLAFSIGMSQEKQDELREAKKPVKNELGLVDLAAGTMDTIDDVQSFVFSDDGAHLAMRRYKAEEQKDWSGTNLVVRTLATGIDMNFGNVAEFAWQDEAALLAMVIDAEGQAGNGVGIYDPAAGTLRMVASEAAIYRGLSWGDESAALAALRVRADSAFEDSTHVVLAWSDVTRDRTPRAFDPDAADGFPALYRVSEHQSIEWSDDGNTVFFGIQERIFNLEADTTIDEIEKDDQPTVEIWHARDVEIIPMQKVRRTRYQRRTHLVAWDLDRDRFVRLGDELTETITRVEGDRYAIGEDVTPYDGTRMFGPEYRDVYLIDLLSGERTKIADAVEFRFGPSLSGKYYWYFKDDHHWTYNIANGRTVNVTAEIPTEFVNSKSNLTRAQKPPYPRPALGWSADDEWMLLHDRYDLWRVDPDGDGGTRLTNGADDETFNRYLNLYSEAEFIDLDQPIYVSLNGEWSKKRGIARVRPGRDVERLVWEDANIGRLTKAEDADVYAYVRQRYDDSPDYFVGGPDLRDNEQVTATNPFHDDYAWGKSELLDYENTWGERLQGALFYPADYEPGQQYPMIVYIYELVSQTVHSYAVPSERSAYNTAAWNAEGYFVYRPDITYRDRNPGLSAVEALEPAVARALETGMIDPDRVGLVGHSWGGYQTAFTVTQTDIFAAGVAGAPLTNLTSMYLSVYWNSGSTDARIFEISQGRMEVPFWEDVDSYIANSPVFHVDKLDTPLLLAHGTEDGAVDYNQGVEYYNAARRAGKDFVMLVYNGENHSNAKKPNQLDYHRRIMEWFGYYLKGDPPADWIIQGLPYETQQRLLKYGRIAPNPVIP